MRRARKEQAVNRSGLGASAGWWRVPISCVCVRFVVRVKRFKKSCEQILLGVAWWERLSGRRAVTFGFGVSCPEQEARR